MIDLGNNWLRRDSGTSGVVFYGYSDNLAAQNGDRCWSILKIETIDSVDSVYWSDNQTLSYNAIWDDRAENFVTPSETISITYSVKTDTFNNAIIDTSWDYLTGVNTYKVYVVDQKGVLYNSLSNPFNNIYASERLTAKINDNRYTFNGKAGMTYSITIEGINQIGTTSSTIDVTT